MSGLLHTYPASATQRDAWILSRRGERNTVDASRPYAFNVEEELAKSGDVVSVATVFLTNRECPWRCLMCDLWKNTLQDSVPAGAIPAQISYALQRLPHAGHIKLYNSGSFFDLKAIPREDYASIAKLVESFERVIVESHPSLVGQSCVEFRNMLTGKLEVAMGLETVNPAILDRLNKRMTLDQFKAAAQFLRENEMDLRVFILVKPPFMHRDEALEWAARSVEFAFDCGATAVTLIPTRGGNGAMEELAAADLFAPPTLAMLEAALTDGLLMNQGGRVFADLWDMQRLSACKNCATLRVSRLRAMNLQQVILPAIDCDRCGDNR